MLSSLSKPFTPPTEEEILRWRYTTYMGESHPASRKVVVEFDPWKIRTPSEQHTLKLIKLVGARYNPGTKRIRMSCESFETQAQNKRFLADAIKKLIDESVDPRADLFADVPVDTRHHKPRKYVHFPKEWIMTPERKAVLEQKRKVKVLEEGKRVEDDRIVSGVASIEAARQLAGRKPQEEPVMAALAQSAVPRGRAGQR